MPIFPVAPMIVISFCMLMLMYLKVMEANIKVEKIAEKNKIQLAYLKQLLKGRKFVRNRTIRCTDAGIYRTPGQW